MGRVASVRVGHPRVMARPGWDHHVERQWTSAYIKDEVAGAVLVGPLGLAGDEQFDKVDHGGPNMAVLAYAAAHYPRWHEELGIAGFGFGAFGENLVIEGFDERLVAIGDRFRVGETVMEVSQPRGPCAHISRRWDRADLLQRVTETARTGWYLRLVETGRVAVGDAVERISQPHPEWPVERVFRYYTREHRDPEGLRALMALERLSAPWREALERRLRVDADK